MRPVLVACEESQAVTIELRALGILAYSCDLKNCSGGHPEWHLKGDVTKFLAKGFWSAVIAHPECTYLTNAGVRWLYNKDGSKNIDRWQRMFEAAEFFKIFLEYDCPVKIIENPIPHGHALKLIGKKYSQIIQPWMFGHMESKATCLWLEGVDLIRPTNNVRAEMMMLPAAERNRIHRMPPSPLRSELRSKTYPGIAKAVALAVYSAMAKEVE